MGDIVPAQAGAVYVGLEPQARPARYQLPAAKAADLMLSLAWMAAARYVDV